MESKSKKELGDSMRAPPPNKEGQAGSSMVGVLTLRQLLVAQRLEEADPKMVKRVQDHARAVIGANPQDVVRWGEARGWLWVRPDGVTATYGDREAPFRKHNGH